MKRKAYPLYVKIYHADGRRETVRCGWYIMYYIPERFTPPKKL